MASKWLAHAWLAAGCCRLRTAVQYEYSLYGQPWLPSWLLAVASLGCVVAMRDAAAATHQQVRLKFGWVFVLAKMLFFPCLIRVLLDGQSTVTSNNE